MLFIFVFIFCISSLGLQAQEIIQEKDSVSIYKDINDFSRRSKFSRFVYKLLFRESALKVENLIPVPTKKHENGVGEHQEGKIIRNITIETLDPFGFSVSNVQKKPKRKLENFGNAFHIKTKEITIRNIMLFKKYDKLDSKLLQESERLIRSQRYVREVDIVAVDIPNSVDSVDVTIRALDSWTLIPTGSLSSNESSVKITERNILGFGHLISGNIKNRFNTNESAVYGQYSINNIKNTYIKLDLDYANEYNNDSRRSININRPFYSVIAKNAGGIFFENRMQTEQFPVDDLLNPQVISYDFQEYWYGRAFKINSKSNPNRYFNNLVLALTYNQKNFGRQPDVVLDPSLYFSKEKNWVGMIGFSKQKFYQDTFLFNFEIEEDIP